jgi:peptide/nickel transport system permease protein
MRIALFIGRRLLLLVPIMLGITLVAFFMTRILPSDPVYSILGSFATQDEVQQKRIEMGLDKPLLVQYGIYLRDLTHGDLGYAYRTHQPVAKDLGQRFPVTFELTTISLFLAVLIAVPLGVQAAVRKDTWFDHVVRVISVGGVAIPIFFTGIVLIFLLYFKLHLAPAPLGRIDVLMEPPRQITGMYTIDALVTGNWPVLRSTLEHMALPVIALVFAMVAPIMRMTRNSMLETLNSRYVQTAKVLGLDHRTVVYQDALRTALLPVVTTIGMQYGWSLGGEVLVETVFAWPGMGYYAVNSILNFDYAPVQGFVLVTAAIFVLINLVVDVLYAVIDPRIRY